MLTTRVGGPADAAAVARLWTVANVARQAHLGLPLGPVAGAVSLTAAEDRVRGRLAGPGAVLILGFAREASGSAPGSAADGEPAAMALVVQALTDDGAGTDPLPGLAHVSMVAVHPDQWGRRLGGVVMQRAQVEARHAGYTRAQLWTHETNHRAQRLYERLGWALSGRTTADEHGEQIRHYTRDL
ncbi:GNAT family N-acetyltransferase [Dactylosporangium sp. NBC_01737]|uniref:GNAT family N-acetyltransferase n=1 Tax=Dactylosporangium sp. NBC_01737 TaxID=2975959 RepID=UPI002E0E1C0E|nr:GNAT family N-acetyltransferase [Dactylosporangium sp. NBC_01737]